jgi:hypothetical protein
MVKSEATQAKIQAWSEAERSNSGRYGLENLDISIHERDASILQQLRQISKLGVRLKNRIHGGTDLRI